MNGETKTGLFFTLVFANIAAYLLIDFLHSMSGKYSVMVVEKDTLKEPGKTEDKPKGEQLENFELRKTVERLKGKFAR